MELIRNHDSGYWDLYVGECRFCSTASREQGEIVAEFLQERVLSRSLEPVSANGAWETGLYAATRLFQRGLAMEALKKTGGDKKAAAALLKMKRTTFQEICKRLEVDALELVA